MKHKHTAQKTSLILITALCAAFASSTLATDWPQFQGPNRDATSSETGLARSWPAEGPKVLWTISLGKGYGSPAIRDGKVFILDRPNVTDKNERKDILRCLDLKTGKDIWEFSFKAPGALPHDGSRGTPTVEDKDIFVLSPFGQIYRIDRESHKPIWKRNIMEDFAGKKTPMWGYSQSPVLYKDIVVVAPQTPTVSVVAYAKATGEIAWTVPALPGNPSYFAPNVVTLDGVDQFVMISGKSPSRGPRPSPDGQVVGISAADGKVLWAFTGWQTKNPITTPVAIDKNRLFITGGYGEGSSMLDIKQVDGKFTATELYNTKQCGSIFHQPLVYKNHLYVNSNGRYAPEGHGLLCMTLDGKVKWQTVDTLNLPNFISGLPSFDWGGMLLADGMIYIMDGKTGILRIIEPNPEKYVELAQAKIFEEETGNDIWSPLALSNGKLLLRDQTQLKCLEVGKP